jgi:aspartate carbamoyltransferase catalytic subunit
MKKGTGMRMKNNLHRRSLVSVTDLSKEEILLILKRTEEMKRKPASSLLHGQILASCFFEPSTRTRLSFEAAMLRLGGNTIGFSDHQSTSTQKGESLRDSMKVISAYADLIVIRHPKEGAARMASETATVPVINAGDGSNQHPTQTLIDLFTIQECQGKLKNINLAFVGDLKHGRTVHSLSLAAALFDMRMFFVSPEALALPEEIAQALKKHGVKFSFHRTIEEVLEKTDVLYMTRIQRERLENTVYNGTDYLLKAAMLEKSKKNLRILHPLPRVNEIDEEIDALPHAYYFQQAANGLYVRMALLSLILGEKPHA